MSAVRAFGYAESVVGDDAVAVEERGVGLRGSTVTEECVVPVREGLRLRGGNRGAGGLKGGAG